MAERSPPIPQYLTERPSITELIENREPSQRLDLYVTRIEAALPRSNRHVAVAALLVALRRALGRCDLDTLDEALTILADDAETIAHTIETLDGIAFRQSNESLTVERTFAAEAAHRNAIHLLACLPQDVRESPSYPHPKWA